MIDNYKERPDYDLVASKYAELVSNKPLNKLAMYPTLLRAVGDVRGRDGLDLATGNGR